MPKKFGRRKGKRPRGSRGKNQTFMKTLSAFKPQGSQIVVKLRTENYIYYSGVSVAANCLSVGTVITALNDFTNFSNVFGKFTITHAKLITLPYAGFVVAAPSVRTCLAVGFFNDGVAVSNPTTYNAVLNDEQAKLVSPFSVDPMGGTLAVRTPSVQDPWISTNSAIYTAAQINQWGKFEWFSNGGTADEYWGNYMIEATVIFCEKF